ncbi:MAG: hypothetical protein HQK60_14500, partial [Deltaproteobacteria bacterium]|nr:hypothetical protein [Deltaproteobacteria bacterium]
PAPGSAGRWLLKPHLLITVNIRFFLVRVVFFLYLLGVLTEGLKDILKRQRFFSIKPEDQQQDQTGQPGLETVRDTTSEQGINAPDHQEWTGYMNKNVQNAISYHGHPARY